MPCGGYTHSDLVTGGGAFPYALPFARTYRSSANLSDVGMGKGWTHSYSLSATTNSDPYEGMGASSPISAVSAVVAILVSQDLLSGTNNAQSLTLAWMVDRWFTDQLTNNVALVSPTRRTTSTNIRAVGAVTPSYDGNGNLTFDGAFNYGYDAENRLVTASQSGSPIASYAYDAQGNRKSKTLGSATTITLIGTDKRALLDYDGTSGQILRWYAFGSGPNDVLNQMNLSASTRQTFISDIQGSVLASLDSGSGALTKAGYQPFGESPSTAGTFRYTGARIDAETNGLYDFRACIYSLVLGRFLQPDPIGTQGGNDLYAYVSNDPLNTTDVLGLVQEPPSGSEGAPPGSNGSLGSGGVDLGIGASLAPANANLVTQSSIASFPATANQFAFLAPPVASLTQTPTVASQIIGAQNLGPPDSQNTGVASPSISQSTPNVSIIQVGQTCAEFIAANCKASVLRVFPGQFLDVDINDVLAAAKAGDSAAQTARKLLTDGRFRKP